MQTSALRSTKLPREPVSRDIHTLLMLEFSSVSPQLSSGSLKVKAHKTLNSPKMKTFLPEYPYYFPCLLDFLHIKRNGQNRKYDVYYGTSLPSKTRSSQCNSQENNSSQ
ncbi:hypothetical protein PHYBLDRAFT_61157 [Phycomyces blakesleeanus NRRL 1555(-)]|uniref:Uncharacterized protein n=1 Tax=Phycomyces blakesleeanus (strain ATCC 8743b / DSM 1359 / FGSC 10004 / NBRC 33097 / NRRL 1555) TaxID=763407 RepID=A0A167N2C5_PHYB8|nr:hypothetical protein PHYBLDRAFT_61157 [Phycomyces blakesleeanus NRRL 1555(-)]OAD74794.1 hypothetical protein PHYBLDRAFT_61157 [Phycomyces blakesleeanus NRRL 1555(-)]|eukprot:XP_018292834.1 hypothetical protein PHYBLDRAFT_61157 [Phycomyces blakesleeanus NRRL 1555(-)]